MGSTCSAFSTRIFEQQIALKSHRGRCVPSRARAPWAVSLQHLRRGSLDSVRAVVPLVVVVVVTVVARARHSAWQPASSEHRTILSHSSSHMPRSAHHHHPRVAPLLPSRLARDHEVAVIDGRATGGGVAEQLHSLCAIKYHSSLRCYIFMGWAAGGRERGGVIFFLSCAIYEHTSKRPAYKNVRYQ